MFIAHLVADPNELRVTQILVGRPFKELDRRYQLRLQPAAFLHVISRKAFAPSPHPTQPPKRAIAAVRDRSSATSERPAISRRSSLALYQNLFASKLETPHGNVGAP
jgi:hypothetical protein